MVKVLRTQHYPNCEDATSKTCRCRWCAGTRHGWQGAIKLAKSDDPVPLKKVSNQAERAWKDEQEKQRKRRVKKPTVAHRAAAMKVCLVDIISWLRSSHINAPGESQRSGDTYSAKPYPEDGGPSTSVDLPLESTSDAIPAANIDNGSQDLSAAVDNPEPSTVVQIESLGRILEYSLKEVQKEYPSEVDPPTRQAMADHFWCEILAQLAYEINQGLSIVDNVPDYVADRIIQRRAQEKRSAVADHIVKSAVKAAWRRIQRVSALSLLAKSRAILLIIRILAVFVCKQPERHQAVVEYCVDPFRKKLLAKTKERLISVFREWLPETNEELSMIQQGEA